MPCLIVNDTASGNNDCVMIVTGFAFRGMCRYNTLFCSELFSEPQIIVACSRIAVPIPRKTPVEQIRDTSSIVVSSTPSPIIL